MLLLIVILQGLQILGSLIFYILYVKLKERRDSDYYTDYLNGKLLMRVYKPEFEFQAIGNLGKDEILDGGNLTAYYKWALIKKNGKKNYRSNSKRVS